VTWPGETLTDTGDDARYTVEDVNTLVAPSAQAFHEVAYQKAALVPNMPPSAGSQFFGVVDIESRGGMVVRLVDTAETELFAQRLEPSRRR